MIRYRFPGFHAFLHEAAARIGRPEAEVPARAVTTLSALANLCAQAGAAEPEHVPEILGKAAEFRDQLRAAYEAAELVLDDARRSLGVPNDPAVAKRPGRPARPPASREKSRECPGEPGPSPS